MDPVHLFLSLSSETEFRRRPPPNPVPVVAYYGIRRGEEYHHTEQFIQSKKAEFCEDFDSYHMIMATKSAFKCKELGRQVKNCNTNEWNKRAKEYCFPGILCKFQQNPGLAAFLKNTGNKTLLECCYDNVWGNGYPLSDPDCLNPQSYTKQGIQGEMLEEIRDILHSPNANVQPLLSGNGLDPSIGPCVPGD